MSVRDAGWLSGVRVEVVGWLSVEGNSEKDVGWLTVVGVVSVELDG